MALGAGGGAPQPAGRADLAGRARGAGDVPATRVLPRAVLVPSHAPQRGTAVGGAGVGTGRRGAGRPARRGPVARRTVGELSGRRGAGDLSLGGRTRALA